jgi:hypothetical protein
MRESVRGGEFDKMVGSSSKLQPFSACPLTVSTPYAGRLSSSDEPVMDGDY